MSEKRFHMNFDKYTHQIMCDGEGLSLQETVKILNEQQATINELKAKLREKEEDEKLYANEILELRETNKEFIQFKELGGDY